MSHAKEEPAAGEGRRIVLTGTVQGGSAFADSIQLQTTGTLVLSGNNTLDGYVQLANNATLLVDYWQRSEPASAAVGATNDEFTGSTLDPGRWQTQDQDYSYGTAAVQADGQNLRTTATWTYNTLQGQGCAETLARLPADAWAGGTRRQ